MSSGLDRRGLGGGGGLPLVDVADGAEPGVPVLIPLRANGLEGRGGGILTSMPSGADLLLGDSDASKADAERGMTWR